MNTLATTDELLDASFRLVLQRVSCFPSLSKICFNIFSHLYLCLVSGGKIGRDKISQKELNANRTDTDMDG
jgi:hypothetical protein